MGALRIRQQRVKMSSCDSGSVGEGLTFERQQFEGSKFKSEARLEIHFVFFIMCRCLQAVFQSDGFSLLGYLYKINEPNCFCCTRLDASRLMTMKQGAQLSLVQVLSSIGQSSASRIGLIPMPTTPRSLEGRLSATMPLTWVHASTFQSCYSWHCRTVTFSA